MRVSLLPNIHSTRFSRPLSEVNRSYGHSIPLANRGCFHNTGRHMLREAEAQMNLLETEGNGPNARQELF